MPEYLETTIDKFTFRVATDRLYSVDGAWLLVDAKASPPRIQLGVTDFVHRQTGGRSLMKAWELLQDDEALKMYVQSEVRAYLRET